jgi:hypothetical protein
LVESAGIGYSTAPGGALAATLRGSGHPDRRNQTRSGEQSPPRCGQREHALFAFAVFERRDLCLCFGNRFAHAAERLFNCAAFCIRAFGVFRMHGLDPPATDKIQR